jgi:DNA-binding SARP family transcriptional activator
MSTTTPMAGTSPIRFRILGSLEFFDGRRWSPIGAAKQRTLLAALLLSANQVVPAERLVSELWTDQPPSSAAGLLAGYVWRLRRLLGDSTGEVLITRPPGYQLAVPPGALDVHEYDDLVAAGRAGLAGNDVAAATDAFGAALGLWRGVPLSDVAPAPAVMAEAARLEESRLAVLESRLGAEIQLGRHDTLLPELKQLVSAYPLRERLHGHLMLTLYRCGQQAEALGAYHDLRRLLVNELGIEPSKPLRELQQQILREDPLLSATVADDRSPAARSGPAGPAGPAGPVATGPPAPDAEPFVERPAELTATAGLLVRGGVCAVYGAAGTGKTALARQAARAVAAHFPDGRLWLDLRASAPPGESPVRPAEAARALLRADDPAGDVPDDPGRAVAGWAAAIAGRRVLVVLDDIADADQVRGFLAPPPGCAVLLTGRAPVAAVSARRQVRLGRLPVAASVALLRESLAPGRIDADPAGAADIARLCEYLPLALRVAANRLALRPEWTVGDFAHRLADPRRRLDLLASGEQSVRDRLQASVRQLERVSGGPAARTALCLLGTLDLAVVGVDTVAALLGEPEHAAHPVVERLVDSGLVDALRLDLYRVPDLVRLVAREQQDAAVDPAAGVRRVIEHYLGLVRDRIGLVRRASGSGSAAAVSAWYRRELGTLRSLADRDDGDLLRKAVDELRWALWEGGSVARADRSEGFGPAARRPAGKGATAEVNPENIGST